MVGLPGGVGSAGAEKEGVGEGIGAPCANWACSAAICSGVSSGNWGITKYSGSWLRGFTVPLPPIAESICRADGDRYASCVSP
jgi:hypothetical protein